MTLHRDDLERARLDARRLRLRHNNAFYGPMKGDTCGCEVCVWLVRFMDIAQALEDTQRELRIVQAERDSLSTWRVDESERTIAAETARDAALEREGRVEALAEKWWNLRSIDMKLAATELRAALSTPESQEER